MAKRQVKLNINGVSYRITDIDKAIPYKEILCSMAKQNELLESKESAVTGKAKPKPRRSEDKKAKPLKSRSSSIKEREPFEVKKSRKIKIIHIGKDEDDEKVPKRGKLNRSHKNKSEATKRTQDDSDIEIYHQSRRRMKNMMKRKWRDESDERMYDKKIQTKANWTRKSPLLHRNHVPNRLMSECDKISIYYLDEKSDKKNERKSDQRKSNSGSSMTGLQSKASSTCNSITKKPILESFSNDGNFTDDKDSGMPSWESEEISSKDDNRTDEQAPNHTVDPEEYQRYRNEVLSQSKICMDPCMIQCNWSIPNQITQQKTEEFSNAAIVEHKIGIENRESKECEAEDCEGRKEQLRERYIEEMGKDTTCLITKENELEEYEVASDFEIIKSELTELSTFNNDRKGNEKSHQTVEDEHASEVQRMNIIYDINSNIVDNTKESEGQEAHFNLENRGSFILIEFDESELNLIDEDQKSKERKKQLLLNEHHCENMITVSEVNLRSLQGKAVAFEEGYKCSASKKIYDNPVYKDHTDDNTKSDLIDSINGKLSHKTLNAEKQEKEREKEKKICSKLKMNEKLQKKRAEKENMKKSNVKEHDLVHLDDGREIKKEAVKCNCDNFIDEYYRNARSCSKKEDELIIRLVGKFTKQTEIHLKSHFNKQGEVLSSDNGNLLVEMDRKEAESKELWEKYTNTYESIYKILAKILFFDLKIEQMKFKLEEVKEMESLCYDGALSDEENDVVKDIIEFRDFLKRVTIMSRRSCSELRATQAQINKLDLILLNKRSVLKCIEEPLSSGRYQNIPRTLLRSKRMKLRK